MKKILIDAGHGGVFCEWYCTAGKRSPEIPPGIYEGDFNRLVAGLLAARLRNMGIDAAFLNPGPMDVPESAKASYGRQAVKQFGPNSVLWLSLHCNASPRPGWDDDTVGATAFVKRNDERSVLFAGDILKAWGNATGIGTTRGVQRRGFNILSGAPVAALLEMGFMTSRTEVARLRLQYDKGVAALGDVIARWCRG